MNNANETDKTAYPTVSPYLIVSDGPSLMDFLKNAFDFLEIRRHVAPDGTIAHAELTLGDSMIMVAEAGESYPANPTMIHLFLNE